MYPTCVSSKLCEFIFSDTIIDSSLEWLMFFMNRFSSKGEDSEHIQYSVPDTQYPVPSTHVPRRTCFILHFNLLLSMQV